MGHRVVPSVSIRGARGAALAFVFASGTAAAMHPGRCLDKRREGLVTVRAATREPAR